MPKPKTYNCPECGKVYKTERGLSAHSKLHKVEDVVQDINVYTQPVQQDVKKVMNWEWYVLAAIGVFLLYVLVLRPWIHSMAVEKNNEVISNENRRIDSIYTKLDTLNARQGQLSDSVRLAVERSEQATEAAERTSANLQQVKAQTEQKLSTTNKRQNEILKKLNEAPDVKRLDSIYNEMFKPGTEMLQN